MFFISGKLGSGDYVRKVPPQKSENSKRSAVDDVRVQNNIFSYVKNYDVMFS